MKTANSFVRGHRRRIATAWLFVCAGTAIGGEPTRTGEDQADPRASQIEIVAIDSVSQRAAIRFDDDREPRPLVVGGAAARDLRLISVRGDLAAC
ncbi:MAG: hypothetical protein HYV17_03725 [Xanthomonadales bacterium]|nr:hypothetical protein [Xanthomonadales bacterium]